MGFRTLLLASIATLATGLAAESQAVELSTPPIASRHAKTFLNCAIQNAGTKSATVRVQIVQIPGGVLSDSGDQAVAPGAGVALPAISNTGCTNGDCPCPNAIGGEACPVFNGTAFCRFVVAGRANLYRAAGCVSSPSSDPSSSPTCVEAR